MFLSGFNGAGRFQSTKDVVFTIKHQCFHYQIPTLNFQSLRWLHNDESLNHEYYKCTTIYIQQVDVPLILTRMLQVQQIVSWVWRYWWSPLIDITQVKPVFSSDRNSHFPKWFFRSPLKTFSISASDVHFLAFLSLENFLPSSPKTEYSCLVVWKNRPTKRSNSSPR